MQKIEQVLVGILIVVSLAACPNRVVGNDQRDAAQQLDSGFDAEVQLDAEVQPDAAQQQDSGIDASVDAEPQQDSEVQNDSAVQQDSEPQQDSSVTIAAEVTYEVDGITDPVWDGVPTVISWAQLTAVNMNSEVTKVKWTFTGVTSNEITDATLLLDGVPLAQQDATWISSTELEFTTSATLIQR